MSFTPREHARNSPLVGRGAAARPIGARRSARWRRYLGSGVFGIAAVLIIALAYAELRFGVLIPTPRAEPPYNIDQAGVFVIVDPARVAPILPDVLAPELGRLPKWIVRRLTPYEAGGGALLDFDSGAVVLSGYLNARRLAPVIARTAAGVNVHREVPEIHWNGPPYEGRPGLLILDGTMPFDPDAEESFSYMWDQAMPPPPLTAEGGHFVEVVFDNRRGHAYLMFASFLRAYDIDLAENQHEISLSSLQFVREARFTMDFAPPDGFRITFVLEIVPDAIDRLGVVNLKVGIEESITDVANRWREDFGLELGGEARWDENKIIYEYRLKGARKFLGLVRDGELR